MTDSTDVDAMLRALLADRLEPAPDPAFADRVIALATYDLKARRARRAAFAQVARETLGLAAVLAAFALLAGMGPTIGFGDVVPAGSPAMLGLAMLLLWALVTSRGSAPALR